MGRQAELIKQRDRTAPGFPEARLFESGRHGHGWCSAQARLHQWRMTSLVAAARLFRLRAGLLPVLVRCGAGWC